jgi:hypothetical protein
VNLEDFFVIKKNVFNKLFCRALSTTSKLSFLCPFFFTWDNDDLFVIFEQSKSPPSEKNDFFSEMCQITTKENSYQVSHKKTSF